jgi:hypothetical protein
VDDQSTAVLQGQLEQAVTGDAQARQQLLELTRDRLTRHARSLLHGRYARLEPFAQTDDVVQQLYVKILQNQDRFWLNAAGEPVRSLAGIRPRRQPSRRPAAGRQLLRHRAAARAVQQHGQRGEGAALDRVP